MRKVLLLLFALVAASSAYTQDFSNKGKEFWIGYGNHVRMFQGNSQQMVLYITSDVTTNGTVSIPGLSWSSNFNVTANQITTVSIPQTARLDHEGLFNTGIHVVAARPVVVYGHIYNSAVSGATLCLPVNTLGREYFSVNYTQVSNEGDSYSYFFVIATEDATTVEITPKAPTLNGWSANTTQTVTLNKGQIYQVLSTVDLTGSTIKSVTGAGGGCKRIAVFCGSGKISIGCPSPSSSDNLYQQIYPTSTWGKKYITVSSHNGSNADHRNFYRIIKSTPSAVVSLDGAFVPDASFVGGLYYAFNATGTHVISSDEPILVAQYFTTQACSGNPVPGDPEMIYLNPIEQTISNVTLFSSPFFQIDYHGLNVVVKRGGATSTALSSMKLDGANIGHLFSQVPGDPAYYYAKLNVNPGTHNLISDSGFNAIAFGLGNAESYGYSAGTNLVDQYQFITVQNDYSTVNFPAGCKNTPLKFSMTLPYAATQLKWIFGTTLNGMGLGDSTITAPVADSTWMVNGRTLHRYKLDRYYTIPTPGTYPISVVATNPTATNGCTGEQEIQYDLQIFDQPVASFSSTHTGCLSDSVAFIDATNGQGRPVTRWWWDFGDGNNASIKNPKHKYATASPTGFTVRLAAITDVGCLSDTAQRTIPISDPPVANFGNSATTCAKDSITFNDLSNPLGSTLVQWTWDFGDGSPVEIKTNGNPVKHLYANPGSYTVKLIVKTNTGCSSIPFTKPITVNPKPVANFVLPAGICLPQGAAQFTDQSTISDGTQAQFTYLWDFGDAITSTATNPVHNYTGVGPFNVKLSVTSNNGCVHDTTKSLSTIFAQPDANFNAPAEICLSDSASFSDISTAPASTVTQWFWDFGDGTTSNLQNPKKKWTTPNTYTVTLYIKSGAGCNSDTATKQVIVNALPTANFTYSALNCAGTDITFTDGSAPNSGTIVEWTWTFGATQVVKTNSNPFTYNFATAGTYTVTLEVKTNKGCKSSIFSRTVVVHPQPVVDFTMPSICLPVGTGQFLDNSTIADGSQSGFTYFWEFGDGGTSTQKNPIHQYTSAGPFTVKLTVTSGNNCPATLSKQITTIYPRPKAEFNVTSEVCLGAPTSFTDQSNGNGSNVTRWRWDFGDGQTDTVRNPTHTYATPNTYTATLYIYTDKGCISDTVTHTTIVNRLPTADFSFSNPTCANRTISFTDNSIPYAGNLLKWNWAFGDGGTSTQQNPQHTYAAAGPYSVRLDVETNKGCKSSITTKQVNINPIPVPKFGLPDVCSNDPFAQFSDSSTIADGTQAQFTYLWDFGDPNANAANPNTSTQKDPRHRYTVAGTYNVRLTVTSGNGCSKDTMIPFVVNGSLPQAGFTLANATDLCSNKDVVITDGSSVDIGKLIRVEIYWDYNNDPTKKTVDNNPTAGKSYSYKYPEFGTPLTKTYQIRYVVYSGVTCLNTFPMTITLKASPDVQFDPMSGVCEEIIPFQVTAARELFGLAGNGVFSGPGISATGTFDPFGAKPGTHTIRYTFNASNGCTTYEEQTIQVYPTPKVDAGPDRTVLEGGFINIIPKVTGSGLTYLWTPVIGLDNPAIASPRFAPPVDMEYTLKVTSRDGCSATDKVKVTLLKQIKVPNAFSPNGDGINDKWEILYLDSYPGCEVQVYNRYGQAIFKSVGYDKAWDGTHNGTPLPVGTYYWIINPKNGRQAITGSVTIIR